MVNRVSSVALRARTFSCNTSTKAWKFSIDNVQVIDALHRPWNQNGSLAGPWQISYAAFAKAGPVPLSRVGTLQQNHTNGLFTQTASGKAANATTWCQTGTSVSVVGFSGADEPLLLDGILS